MHSECMHLNFKPVRVTLNCRQITASQQTATLESMEGSDKLHAWPDPLPSLTHHIGVDLKNALWQKWGDMSIPVQPVATPCIEIWMQSAISSEDSKVGRRQKYRVQVQNHAAEFNIYLGRQQPTCRCHARLRTINEPDNLGENDIRRDGQRCHKGWSSATLHAAISKRTDETYKMHCSERRTEKQHTRETPVD